MDSNISFVIDLLGNLTLLGQITAGVLAVLLLFIFIKKPKKYPPITKFISENSLALALLVATVATLGSLFLSEIAHFTPCKLCWYQRIFMYPQVLLLGIALWKNDWGVKKYVLPMAVIGLLIGGYHYALQMYPALPCSDEVASCAAKQFAQFGYITIPLMSFTAFLLIILLMLFPRKK